MNGGSPGDPGPALTLREAATRTGISVHVLRRYIHEAVLPAKRNGNRYEVTIADLDQIPGRLEERRLARERACQEELEAVVRRVVDTFPPLSDEQKKELGRLLGSVPVRRTPPTHIHCTVCGETWDVPADESDRVFLEAVHHTRNEHPGDEPSTNIQAGEANP